MYKIPKKGNNLTKEKCKGDTYEKRKKRKKN